MYEYGVHPGYLLNLRMSDKSYGCKDMRLLCDGYVRVNMSVVCTSITGALYESLMGKVWKYDLLDVIQAINLTIDKFQPRKKFVNSPSIPAQFRSYDEKFKVMQKTQRAKKKQELSQMANGGKNPKSKKGKKRKRIDLLLLQDYQSDLRVIVEIQKRPTEQ